MSTLHRAARASRILAASTAVISLCRFVRNAVLARMLLPADFGVGATFTLALTFLELITELGPAKQLVQAKHGDDPKWQNVAHAVLAVRGLLIAIILFAAGGLIARLIGAPEATASFRCLAIVPLLRSFEHLDITRFQRELRMGRLSAVNTAPEILTLLAAPLLAWALDDYRAFLAVTLLTAVVRTILTHALATRRYSFSFDRAIAQRFIAFGWPLLGNSLLLYLIMHGERFLVAANFDLSTLGAYSVALTLAFTPTTLLANLHSSIALPIFSRRQDNLVAFQRVFASSAQMMCLAAGCLAIVFVISGSWLIGVMFGERYLLAQQAVPWIGLMCAVRVARTTPAMASVGMGDTRIALLSNLARGASFLGALAMIRNGFDIGWIPACGFFGEITAYMISLALLRRRYAVGVGVHLRCFASVSAVVAAVWLASRMDVDPRHVPVPAMLALGLVALMAFALMAWKDLRRMMYAIVFSRHPVGG